MRQRRIALAVGMVLLVAACGPGDDAATTTTVAVTTTTIATTTTVATTTTAATTTTMATTTTTLATTTTTLATTTTEAPTLVLTDEGIEAGATWVPFGSLDEDTIVAVSAVLGAPTDDSGWIDSFSVYGTCPGSVVRGVHWDAFVALFTQADTDFWTAGVPHFFGWYYTDVPPDIATSTGLVIGDTLETLEALYGGPSLEISESPFDPSAGVWSYDLVGWTGLSGFSDGMDPSDVVTSINGGRGCGE